MAEQIFYCKKCKAYLYTIVHLYIKDFLKSEIKVRYTCTKCKTKQTMKIKTT